MTDIWDEALAEAYTSSPTDDVILPTLELRHPSFLDEDGIVTPIRVVRDTGNLIDEDKDLWGWNLTLEDGAPLNPGASVLFQSCMFDFDLPEQTQQRLPEIQITITNVTRLVSQYLDSAVSLRQVIEVTYREFLMSDVSEPKFILGGLSMSRVKSDIYKVTGTASFTDLINKSFPRRVYRLDEFPGLATAAGS